MRRQAGWHHSLPRPPHRPCSPSRPTWRMHRLGRVKRRAELLKLCAAFGAAPVAGSNNQGWGRAAPGWTILRIPGWRSLTPVALDRAILATLASRERGRIVVIERVPPIVVGESIHLAAAFGLISV